MNIGNILGKGIGNIIKKGTNQNQQKNDIDVNKIQSIVFDLQK